MRIFLARLSKNKFLNQSNKYICRDEGLRSPEYKAELLADFPKGVLAHAVDSSVAKVNVVASNFLYFKQKILSENYY